MRRVAVTVLLLAGCGGGGGPRLVPDSPLQQQNVMVIDEGMDLSVPDLAGKVSGAYTETCASGPADAGADPFAVDGGPLDAGPTFDALKQELIAAYAQVDDSCHLKTGISAKSDPLHAIEKYRDRWNAMITGNQRESYGSPFSDTDWKQITGPIDDELATFDYHGTATSTTVAHGNDGVRLVLVERELMSEEQSQAAFSCFVQSEIDQTVALLSDPDVMTAAAHQVATVDMDFADAMTAHHVGVVNESFGFPARASLEALQAAQCPDPIDLSRYYAVFSAIDLAHAATLAGPDVLTVKAAGNDGANINSAADALDCNPGDPTSLVVGSYDPATGEQNSFTNTGACVDLYAPGQAIVTMYAGGWLLPVDGTSFASPLTARFASMSAPSPFSVATTRQAVLSSLDPYLNLPASLIPTYFFYTPLEVYTEALIAAPVRRAPSPRLTTAGFHRFMAPLRLVRSLTRR